MSSTRDALSAVMLLACVCACACAARDATPRAVAPPPSRVAATDWATYGNDPGGTRWSPLQQIDRTNVARLHVAWTYHTGELLNDEHAAAAPTHSSLETTAIVADGTLYLNTPLGRVVALDPETGNARWTFDAKVDRSSGEPLVARGVALWRERRATPTGACRRRVFFGTHDARLFAVDADTGAPCADFGNGGVVDLLVGLPRANRKLYQVNSPPTIAGDLVVVGSAIPDNERVDAPSGAVRAFDARTGALRWSWDPIPRDRGDAARATWSGDSSDVSGGGNVWSVMSFDADRDLLFLPTTSASVDFYGGNRAGDNLYTDSVVALRASTGQRVWSFQTVHHDVWDYDLAAQPTLVTVSRGGRDVDAVAQVTKTGLLFVLDRVTGRPLFPVEERPVPTDGVPGEALSPTQPFPTRPPPLVPQHLGPEDAWGRTEEDLAWCRERLKQLRTGPIYTPPSLQGTVVFPGNLGGMHWGGAAFDRARGLLVTSTNRVASIIRLFPRERLPEERKDPEADIGANVGVPYAIQRDFVIGPHGLPCNAPPWGTLVAVDLAAGAVKWEVPLGVRPQLREDPRGRRWGSVNLGGPIVTAGGLVFVAAAFDAAIRAFDLDTGAELWQAQLPAVGKATPMTYVGPRSGKQYVVIAAGGNPPITPPGDAVVAFALSSEGTSR